MAQVSDADSIILCLLSFIPEGCYGYEIEKMLGKSRMRVWGSIAFSSIYHVLKRLEQKQMIAGKLEYVQGKPPRKRYQISELGKIALRDKVKYTLLESSFTPNPVDLSLMILPILEKEDACEFLKLHLTALQEKYAECTAALAELSRTHSPSIIPKHLELHSTLLAFRIEWTENLLNSVSNESEEERAAGAKWLKQEALLKKCTMLRSMKAKDE